MDMAWTSAAEIAAAIGAGDTSAQLVVDAALKRIGARNRALNAFTAVTGERARERARAIDAARAASRPLGPLAGVPFAVKNLFDVAELPTLAGSKINRDRPPAVRDATLIARLEAAGAILVGALNMGEYAYDFTGENLHDGASRNPHDTTRMTGGSSGGSGGAVAGGLVPIALGSDTNGSIRVPASFCGIFGIKPTYGRLSRARTFPVRRKPRSRRPVRALGGRSRARLRRHAWTRSRRSGVRRPAGRAGGAAARTRRGRPAHRNRRRLFPQEYVPGSAYRRGSRGDGAARSNAKSSFQKPNEHAQRPSSLPPPKARACISIGCGRGRSDFDPVVRDRLIAGAMIPASLVTKAQKFRRWYRDARARLFNEVDVILAPSTPVRGAGDRPADVRARWRRDAAAAEHRHLHAADLVHRAAGGRRAGAAVAAADRRADHRGAVARGCRDAGRIRARNHGRRARHPDQNNRETTSWRSI